MVSPELESSELGLVVTIGNYTLRLLINANASYINPLPQGTWSSILESLATVPAHRDAGSGLRRYRFDTDKIHSALHVIDDASATNEGYCDIHTHDGIAELNVLVPSSKGLTVRCL